MRAAARPRRPLPTHQESPGVGPGRDERRRLGCSLATAEHEVLRPPFGWLGRLPGRGGRPGGTGVGVDRRPSRRQPARLGSWRLLARKRAFFSRFPQVFISHHLRVAPRLVSKKAARHVGDAHNAILPARARDDVDRVSGVTLRASSTESEPRYHSCSPRGERTAEAWPPVLQSLMTWMAAPGGGTCVATAVAASWIASRSCRACSSWESLHESTLSPLTARPGPHVPGRCGLQHCSTPSPTTCRS